MSIPPHRKAPAKGSPLAKPMAVQGQFHELLFGLLSSFDTGASVINYTISQNLSLCKCKSEFFSQE